MLLVFFLHALLDRTREFKAQAKLGQPIVRAIEEFRKQTGNYPPSLAELAPKYLPIAPDTIDLSKSKDTGWEYRMIVFS